MMPRRYFLPLLSFLILAVSASAQQPRGPMNPDPAMPLPTAPKDTVFMEDLNWLEIRDAIAAGKTTAILSTGGIEMNGPHLVSAKHNYILKATTEVIARRLGNALVAPIVGFVPQGGLEPPTGHMRFAGSFTVSDATYEALLTELTTGLKIHGFRNIVLIGDSGGNQKGLKAVADKLNPLWKDQGVRVHFIEDYYTKHPAWSKWQETQGINEVDKIHHSSYTAEAILLTQSPEHIRLTERRAAGLASLHGVSLLPVEKTLAHGYKALAYCADVTCEAINQAIATK
jgi:creatinine amidohydrolase